MTMTDDELAPILQTCLEQLASGVAIETCLDAYPDQHEQLEPLLRTALGLVSLPRPALTPAAHAAIEQRILAQVALRRIPVSDAPNPAAPPAPAPPPMLFGIPIWVIWIIALGIGLLLMITLLRATMVVPTTLPQTPSTIVITPRPSATAPPATMTLPSPVPTAFLRSNSTAQPVMTAETIVQRRPDPTTVPLPPATARPATPANPPAAPPDSGDDKNCQGRQIGRDDKKCEPDKPDKPDKKDDDKPPGKKGG